MECNSSQTPATSVLVPESGRQKRAQAASSFIQCVYKMVEGEHQHGIVHWSLTSDSFIAEHCEGLIRVLPKYFKTRNYTSFVRQLNMYGFHKVKGGVGFSEFKHPHFKRYQQDNLRLIKRKLPGIWPDKMGAAGQFFNGEIATLKDKISSLRDEINSQHVEHKKLTKEVRGAVQSTAAKRSSYALKIKRLLFILYLGGAELLPRVADMLSRTVYRSGILSSNDRHRSFCSPLNITRLVKDLHHELDSREEWLGSVFSQLLNSLTSQLRNMDGNNNDSNAVMQEEGGDAETASKIEVLVCELNQQLISRHDIGLLTRTKSSDIEASKALNRCETFSTKDAESAGTGHKKDGDSHSRKIKKRSAKEVMMPLTLQFTKSAGSRIFSERNISINNNNNNNNNSINGVMYDEDRKEDNNLPLISGNSRQSSLFR